MADVLFRNKLNRSECNFGQLFLNCYEYGNMKLASQANDRVQ